MLTRFYFASLAALCFLTANTQSATTLSPPFTDHMVVQRDKPLLVWGWDKPGSQVTVSLAGKTAKATTDAEGNWRTEIEAPPVGDSHELLVTGSSEVRCQDVAAGEVWLASGQSNMVMPLRDTLDLQEALQSADNPQIRFFQIKRTAAESPQKAVEGNWVPSSKSVVANFSAAAYYFADRLQRELNVPIGIIESAWGGSSILAWLPDATMKALPDYETQRSTFEMRSARYQKAVKEWEANGKTGPRPPSAGGEVQQGLSVLDNGMTHPIKPYPIRGVIWYQGEANAVQADNYKKWFAALVQSWRDTWSDPELPVYFVQLPGFDTPVGNQHWPTFRNAQRELAKEIPHTDMAVNIDAGDPTDIHPKNKKTPGLRLAQLALAHTYGKDIVPGGPDPESATLQGETIEISFSRTGDGLVLQTETATVALVDSQGKTADAAIKLKDDKTIVVEVPSGFKPVAVRYAWEGYPTATLYNKEGFPASPFELKL